MLGDVDNCSKLVKTADFRFSEPLLEESEAPVRLEFGVTHKHKRE